VRGLRIEEDVYAQCCGYNAKMEDTILQIYRSYTPSIINTGEI